jgi:hypothetical protein
MCLQPTQQHLKKILPVSCQMLLDSIAGSAGELGLISGFPRCCSCALCTAYIKDGRMRKTNDKNQQTGGSQQAKVVWVFALFAD